jgi:hypothetical protein
MEKRLTYGLFEIKRSTFEDRVWRLKPTHPKGRIRDGAFAAGANYQIASTTQSWPFPTAQSTSTSAVLIQRV